jgi:energy-coupling factor transporter ATP-binding protein EcfA2
VILTEAVLDTLALETMDIHGSIPCYGVNGFTGEHEKLLKDERVKHVIVAFDADEAGEKGARTLATRLASLGIEAFAAFPPRGKDWNELLTLGGTKDEVEAVFSAAREVSLHGIEEVPPTAVADGTSSVTTPRGGLAVRREKLATIFTTGGLSYRVSGVKELFVSNLKVNVRTMKDAAGRADVAPSDAEAFYDTFDLYSSRGRSGYATQAARLFNLEAARVERDLVAILEYLEDERDRRLSGNGRVEVTMSDQERRLGMAFLESPALFEEVTADMEELGYVGEDLNKLLLYLCASSRKLTDPLSVIIISQSASGKSYLVDTVRKLMPPEDVIAVTSLSDQALNYIDDLMHKFLVLGEAVHGDVVEHQIREMLSAKELARLVTLKDPETGKLGSRIVRTPAVVASVMSTTNPHVNAENSSRCFVINTDESREQTRRIHEIQKRKYSLERYRAKEKLIPPIIAKHHAAQRLLTPVAIVNEFSRYVGFPDGLMRVRRDHERFMDLIAAVCFLRQYQKERKCDGGMEFIVCDIEDYRVAHRIMVSGVLSSSLLELPRGAQELYERLRIIARERASAEGIKPNEVRLSQREIRETTGLGQSWVREHLRRLVEYEYLRIARGGVRGERCQYRLLFDEPIAGLDLGMIPEPDRMAAIVSNNEK